MIGAPVVGASVVVDEVDGEEVVAGTMELAGPRSGSVRRMKVSSARKLWDMVGGPMPRGLLGLGSGDIYRAGDRWILVLGGYSTSLRNRLYTATAPASADLSRTEWTVTVGPDGRARPLLADPPRGAWDGGGMHTPSYLPACEADGAPARIYYAGRAGRRHVLTARRQARA